MREHSVYHDAALEAAKSAPPLAVTGAMVAGMSINDWVALLTGLYVLLQIVLLIRKELREKRLREERDA